MVGCKLAKGKKRAEALGEDKKTKVKEKREEREKRCPKWNKRIRIVQTSSSQK